MSNEKFVLVYSVSVLIMLYVIAFIMFFIK